LTNKKHCERDIEKTLPEQNRPAISLLKTYVSARHHPGPKNGLGKIVLNGSPELYFQNFFGKMHSL